VTAMTRNPTACPPAPDDARSIEDRRAVFLAIATLRDGRRAADPELAKLTDAQRSLLVDALRTIERSGAPGRSEHDI